MNATNIEIIKVTAIIPIKKLSFSTEGLDISGVEEVDSEFVEVFSVVGVLLGVRLEILVGVEEGGVEVGV